MIANTVDTVLFICFYFGNFLYHCHMLEGVVTISYGSNWKLGYRL